MTPILHSMCTLDPRHSVPGHEGCAGLRTRRRHFVVRYWAVAFGRLIAFRRGKLVLQGDGSKPVEDVTAVRGLKVGGPFEIVGVAGALTVTEAAAFSISSRSLGVSSSSAAANVLFETVQFAGPGYGHYPRLSARATTPMRSARGWRPCPRRSW